MPPIYQKKDDIPVVGPSLMEQLDALQSASEGRRDRALGPGWIDATRDFYNLNKPSKIVPSFRPTINIPHLQVMNLSEASELAESDPVIYLTYDDERRNEEEKYIQKIWRTGAYNIENMLAMIWAMSVGTGVTMVGYDATLNGGRGAPWVKNIPIDQFFPDPDAGCEDDCQYMQYVTYRSKSQLIEKYGPRAEAVKTADAGSTSGARPIIRVGGGGPYMAVPERSPASYSRDIGYRTGFGGSLLPLRSTIIEDFTMEKPRDPDSGKLADRYERKYPQKRHIVDATNVTLYDDNYIGPYGMYPFCRFLAIPPLEGFWGVDPTRLSLSLQELAGRFYTQYYENAYRTNNSIVVIEEGSGVTRENFRGMPGEVVVIKPNKQPPHIIAPTPLPAHLMQMPDRLLQLSETLQQRTGGRTGEPGQGNQSADLFEAAVGQGQPITRMRSRLMARSIQREARLVFGYMLSRFAGGRNKKGWEVEGTNPEAWELEVDPSSIFPYSGAALRRMVPQLRQMGLLDTRRALEFMNIPHADEIADEVKAEEQLGALAAVKKVRR